MAAAAEIQLFASLKGIFKSGAYSDLTITCIDDTYKVHKAIVCERADFFARNLKFGGKESESGIIDLPDDKPATVRLLMHYLYGSEYKPLLLDTKCWAGVTLSAFKQAVNEARPLDNANSQPYRYDFPHTCSHPNRACTKPHICPHHSCSNNKDCRTGCSNFNCEECNPSALPLSLITGEADQLLLHSEMYEIADKYDVVGLKDLVIEKFHRACQHFWDSDMFSVAAHHVFSTTPDHDIGLRDIVSATISAHMGLIKKPEVKALLNEFNGLALGILEEKIIEHGW